MASELITLTRLMGKPNYLSEKRMVAQAEAVILSHISRRRVDGDLFPVTSDDLVALIEHHAEDLNVYDDISHMGHGVEGATLFEVGRRPSVSVSPKLSESANQNRFKSTLAHEFGHVYLHDPMFQERNAAGLFGADQVARQVSFREGESSESKVDLFEWQAWYFSRSILMPVTALTALVSSLSGDHVSDIWHKSELGLRIIGASAARFGVSEVFARIHLTKVGALTVDEPSATLF